MCIFIMDDDITLNQLRGLVKQFLKQGTGTDSIIQRTLELE